VPTAAGILPLVIVLARFISATGKIEGYDPINEIFFRDNTALGICESATPITDNLSAFVPHLFE
jgi:hypothetical protein